ncbi:hypothetical protein EYF80_033868 [Liparis tanakae]|uniref:Uncharacterized protein n=1 Tax=Liparis tanakae TaxID=230148 RepID=A0A4Z2GT78_9TELE|nr:hypothetical protein EYF80_033868 [Liparis tanakae]
MAGKEDVEAEVEASAGGSRFGLANGSEGGGQPADGGCWMVWRECPPSIEGRLCGPSKSYSSLTIRAEVGPELALDGPLGKCLTFSPLSVTHEAVHNAQAGIVAGRRRLHMDTQRLDLVPYAQRVVRVMGAATLETANHEKWNQK